MRNEPSRAKHRAVKFSALMLALAVLNGCGGGGGDSSSPPATNNTSPPVTTITSRVSVDASIPESVRQQVAEVVSSVATVDKIPNTIVVGDGEDVVLALNAQGKIVMTGIAASDGTTAFNAASTAVGLVSFALDTPENLTEKQVNEKIRSAAGFAQLTNLVDAVLKAGKIAADDANVLQQVLLVAQQVKKSTTVAAQSKTGELLATPKMLPTDPSVSTDYPFTLIKNEDWIGKVSFDTNKTVKNTMPLSWPVLTKDVNGNVLGEFNLPPTNITSRTAGLLGGILGSTYSTTLAPSITVSDDGGKTFELTVGQTPASLRYNKAHLFVDVAFKSLGFFADADDSCRFAYVEAIVGSEDMTNLLAANMGNILNRLEQWKENSKSIFNALTSTPSIIEKCGSKSAQNFMLAQVKRISAKLSYIVPIYNKIIIAKDSYDIATFAERLLLINYHEGKPPKKYTVCVGKNGQVANCAVNYIVSLSPSMPDNSAMTAGVEFGMEVIAKDSKGGVTLLPQKLDVYISHPMRLDYYEETEEFTSIGAGNPTIVVKDPITGVSSQPIFVNIYEPRLNKTKITLKVDESITLPLQNAQGQNIVLNGMTDWGNSDTTVASLNFGTLGAISDLKNKATSITIKGLKKGTTHITARNLTDNSAIELLTVTVGEPSGYVKISATGQQLPDNATDWNCVLDEQTGLMWENKTNDGGLRDKDHSYSWFEDSAGYADTRDFYIPRNGYSSVPSDAKPYGFYCNNTLAKCNTKAFIAAVNSQKLCGYSNWRLPNKDELVPLVKKYIPDYFGSSVNKWYWSASPNAVNVNGAWLVYFNGGLTLDSYYEGIGYPVRAVRASQ